MTKDRYAKPAMMKGLNMIDIRRKLLTIALGECWHEWKRIYYPEGSDDYDTFCQTCGGVNIGSGHNNRTFDKADDYEALREKVIVPNIGYFRRWMLENWMDHAFNLVVVSSPEERNEIICDFGITCLGWTIKEQEGNDGAEIRI